MSEVSEADKKAFTVKWPGSTHTVDKRVQSLTSAAERRAGKKALRSKLRESSERFNQGIKSWSVERTKARADSLRLNFKESIRRFDVRVRSHEERYSFMNLEGNKNNLRRGTATNSLHVFDRYYKVRIPEDDIWPKLYPLRFPPVEAEHHVTVDDSSERYKTAREADPDSICVCRTKKLGYASSSCDCTPPSNTPYSHTPCNHTPRTHTPYIYIRRANTSHSVTSEAQTPGSHTPRSRTPDTRVPESDIPESRTPQAHTSDTRRPRSRTRRSRSRRSRSPESRTPNHHSPDSRSADSCSSESNSSASHSPGSRSSDSDSPDSDSPEGNGSLEIIDLTSWEEDESLRPMLYDHDFDTFTSPHEKKAEAIATCLQEIKDMGIVRLFPQISPTRLFIQTGPHSFWRNIIPGGWAWGLRPLYEFSLVAAQDTQDYDLDDLAGATDHTILAQGESFKTFKLALRSLKEVVRVALTVEPNPYIAGTDNALRYTPAEEGLAARVNVSRRMRGLPALPFTVESPGLEALKATCSGCRNNRPALAVSTDVPSGLDVVGPDVAGDPGSADDLHTANDLDTAGCVKSANDLDIAKGLDTSSSLRI